jgi:hypothetical protein
MDSKERRGTDVDVHLALTHPAVGPQAQDSLRPEGEGSMRKGRALQTTKITSLVPET